MTKNKLLEYEFIKIITKNKEKPECKNYRTSFNWIKIKVVHKKKNEILNIFIKPFKKKL